MPASSGDRLPRPAHCDRWFASPSMSRTRIDDGERADRREPVGDQVEHDARLAVAYYWGERSHRGQQETGVGDRGVCEQPLHVGLGDTDDRTDRPS